MVNLGNNCGYTIISGHKISPSPGGFHVYFATRGSSNGKISNKTTRAGHQSWPETRAGAQVPFGNFQGHPGGSIISGSRVCLNFQAPVPVGNFPAVWEIPCKDIPLFIGGL
jgi:hypothetical protein